MRLSILILSILGLYGCANIPRILNEAQKTEEQSECRSVIEASLIADTVYIAKPPFLVLKKSEGFDERRSFRGSIVSITDTGIMFVKAKDGLYTPEPKFYPFGNIACLVDSNNHIIYGELNKNTAMFWNMELVCKKLDTVETKPITLVLPANNSASYCVEPGEYRIIYLRFRSSKDYLDQGDSLSSARFFVSRDAITYIGTFHLEYTWTPSPDMTIVPITVLHRPGMNENSPFVGGAIGGLLQYYADKEKAEKEKKESPFHALKVTIDSSYVPSFKSHLPKINCPITIK
jgi:hypothetical protein